MTTNQLVLYHTPAREWKRSAHKSGKLSDLTEIIYIVQYQPISPLQQVLQTKFLLENTGEFVEYAKEIVRQSPHHIRVNMALMNAVPITHRQRSNELTGEITPLACQQHELHERGFTLIELLIAVAIIGVLSVISMTSFSAIKSQARNTRAAEEIRVIEKDITAYAIEKGAFPASLADVGRDGLIDPWGNHYEYHPYVAGTMRTFVGEPMNLDYDLFSVGADRDYDQSLTETKSRDDIIRVNNGVWVGPVRIYIPL